MADTENDDPKWSLLLRGIGSFCIGMYLLSNACSMLEAHKTSTSSSTTSSTPSQEENLDDLADQTIDLLKNEGDNISAKEAKCMVLSLKETMVPKQFKYRCENALERKDPTAITEIITNHYSLSYYLPTQKKQRLYRTLYNECISGTKNTLNERNYKKYDADFTFSNSMPVAIASECEDENKSVRCISTLYHAMGQKNKIQQKYLNKVIRAPLHAWTYDNGDQGDLFIMDSGIFNSYTPSSEAFVCHLLDEDNVSKYVSDVKREKATVEVVGVISEIGSDKGEILLDPCYYVQKIEK